MNSCCGLLLLPILLSSVVPITVQANPINTTSSDASFSHNSSQDSLVPCPQPALSRLVRHLVTAGETLESIAQQYNLIPATLMGLNPALQNGKVAVGSVILIPPYNGIRVEVPSGQTWKQVAATYKVRPDILFEVNGCQTAPKVMFVPGVNWSPQRPVGAIPSDLTSYPLPSAVTVVLGYGWQLNPATGKVFFHSGLDLPSPIGTPVKTIGAGTVAFAGEQGNYGNLVVVNHQAGRQSRYAHLKNIAVKVGQTVKQGQLLGTVGTTGTPTSTQSHLHFEVRYASQLGWVAEDPTVFLKKLKRYKVMKL